MRKVFLGIFIVLMSGSILPARALDDPYKVTDQERAACGGDAFSLCRDAYPDETKLLACLKVNRRSLSPVCRPVFEAGLRSRNLR